MKLKEILNIEKAVMNLGNVLLPTPEENRRVYKLIKVIKQEVENYDLQINKILQKYGQQSENGSKYIPKNSPNFDIALKEISALESMEINLDFKPIQTDFNSLNLNAADAYNLEKAKIIELKEGE